MNTIFKKQLLEDLFRAYYDARKKKRKTINSIRFEINLEKEIFKLYEDLLTGRYEIGKSICFISFGSVRREIFAADFRDRIVHHLIYNYINPIFEKIFINDSYSCRIGKGTSYGTKRADHFIRSCSENYKKDCYILKLDIAGYFMSIDKSILFEKIERVMKNHQNKSQFDVEWVLQLIRKVIFNDPTKDCIVRGKREDWVGLPKDKSLFFSGYGRGLPIGNLTSQLFANVYLGDFDNFVMRKLGCKYYGRYVDDILIIHRNREHLKSVIEPIRKYLSQDLHLSLHKKKIYLQHFSKGVDFLGSIIKPHRIYLRNRVKGKFFQRIRYWKFFLKKHKNVISKSDLVHLISCFNSYLGTMKSKKTFNLRREAAQRIASFLRSISFSCNSFEKIVLIKKIREKRRQGWGGGIIGAIFAPKPSFGNLA